MHIAKEFKRNRIIGLDLVRVVAIFSVLFTHSVDVVAEGSGFYHFFLAFRKIDGVSIFFVLSGFLIGHILIRESPRWSSPGGVFKFLIRRWFRTLPNYFLVLTILVILYYSRSMPPARDWWQYFFFVQNLFDVHPRFFPEAWSLSVEEWFYLIFPLGLWFLRGTARQKYLGLALAMLLVSSVLRIWKFETLGPFESLDREFRKIVLFRFDAIAMGLLGAYLNAFHAGYWKKFRWLAFALGILIYTTFYWESIDWFQWYYPTYYNWESLAIGMFLPVMSGLKKFKMQGLNRLLVFFSAISYSMYLTNHTLIKGFVMPWIESFSSLKSGPENHLQLWLYYLLTISLSFLLFEFFERPLTNLRERVFRQGR